jgi:hypothetical protein
LGLVRPRSLAGLFSQADVLYLFNGNGVMEPHGTSPLLYRGWSRSADRNFCWRAARNINVCLVGRNGWPSPGLSRNPPTVTTCRTVLFRRNHSFPHADAPHCQGRKIGADHSIIAVSERRVP